MTKKTDLSLTHPAIREAYKHWGKQKVNHFSRIIRANLNSKEKDYISMTRKAYTREEFIVMLNEQNEAEKVLFEGFKKSLENRPIHIRLIGPGLIDSQQKDSWKLNYRELEGFYGK
jgi:hypothetical protein